MDGVPLTEEEISWVRLWRTVRAAPRLPEYPTYPTWPILQPPVIYKQWTSDKTWNPCRWCGNNDCHQSHIICETMACDSTGLLKMIEEHPEWDWSGINVCAGNWHAQ